jgi:hypothetical protein
MDDIRTWRFILETPSAAVDVTRDIPFDAEHTLDVYTPAAGGRAPAVVLVSAYPTEEVQRVLGARPKDLPAAESWGCALAHAGLAAVTYTNTEPARDLDALLRYLHEHAPALGIDARPPALWAASGNVPLAVSRIGGSRCAALMYGYMPDIDGTTVADAAARFGFANPAIAIERWPREIPIVVVRAGLDGTPGLNATIDRFAIEAHTRGLPVTIVRHDAAPHAFDYADRTEASRGIVRGVIEFLQRELGVEPGPGLQ